MKTFVNPSRYQRDQPVLGRFGHHPDQEIDSNIEIERLQGLLSEARAGLVRALDYDAATPKGLSIKADVRDTINRIGKI